jgi:hypothetical protein
MKDKEMKGIKKEETQRRKDGEKEDRTNRQ